MILVHVLKFPYMKQAELWAHPGKSSENIKNPCVSQNFESQPRPQPDDARMHGPPFSGELGKVLDRPPPPQGKAFEIVKDFHVKSSPRPPKEHQ